MCTKLQELSPAPPPQKGGGLSLWSSHEVQTRQFLLLSSKFSIKIISREKHHLFCPAVFQGLSSFIVVLTSDNVM